MSALPVFLFVCFYLRKQPHYILFHMLQKFYALDLVTWVFNKWSLLHPRTHLSHLYPCSQITQHKWAWPFMQPVDVKGLGLDDYYEVTFFFLRAQKCIKEEDVKTR